jgi:protein O-GlcNAc transferase
MPDSRQDRRRQQRDPNYHFENGRRIAKAGDWAAAADAFAAAIKLAPREARFHRALGAVLLRLNRFSEAVTTYERAVNLRPEHAETLAGWGMALGHAGRHAEAIAPLDRALALDPSLASARYSLGLSLARAGDFDRALTFLTGSDAETLLARGAVLMSMGRIDEAERDFHAADTARPNQIITESNLAMLGQYRRDASAPMLLDWHRRFGRSYGGVAPAAPRAYSTDSDRDRQLTIGFVSGDFRRHAVGVLTIRVIEGLARRGVRLVCFANQSDSAGDDISARFRAAATWQSIYQRDDDAAASLIAAEEIDVLVDLSGHTAANRLRLFQRRPAPVQLTWAGYVGTTGLKVFDGLIADAIEVPDGEEQQYSEPIIRLPLCYASFDPPDFAPPVGPLPALATGIITFGSFNRPAKLNEDVLTLWAELLRAVPN